MGAIADSYRSAGNVAAVVILLLLIALGYVIATSNGLLMENYVDLGETFILNKDDLQYTCQILKDNESNFVVNCLEAVK
jgi:hypothetical protein